MNNVYVHIFQLYVSNVCLSLDLQSQYTNFHLKYPHNISKLRSHYLPNPQNVLSIIVYLIATLCSRQKSCINLTLLSITVHFQTTNKLCQVYLLICVDCNYFSSLHCYLCGTSYQYLYLVCCVDLFALVSPSIYTCHQSVFNTNTYLLC